MRHILVDHARAKKSQKRRSDGERIPLEELEVSVELPAIELLDLDDALERLAIDRPEHARVVELRVFGGLTLREVADVMGHSEHAATRRWIYAVAWLTRVLDSTVSEELDGTTGTD